MTPSPTEITSTKRTSISRRTSATSGSSGGTKYTKRKKTYTVQFWSPHDKEPQGSSSENEKEEAERGDKWVEASPRSNPHQEYHGMLDDVEFSGEGLPKSVLIHLITHMLVMVGAQDYLCVNYSQLHSFVDCVASNYNDPPFHRFEHAFCVTQMAYTILHKTDLFKQLSVRNKTILLISCLCHDVDHQGYTNPFHVRNATPLAEMYNNTCPMENHHAAIALELLKFNRGILQNLEEGDAKSYRDTVVAIILATDMEKHGQILQKASEVKTSDSNYSLYLLQVIMKAADLSNELRSPTVAYTWIHRMYEELNLQMSNEGMKLLPTDPSFIANDQIQFLTCKIFPIYKQLNAMTNNGAQFFLNRIQKSLRRHQSILGTSEKSPAEPQESSSSQETPKSKRSS